MRGAVPVIRITQPIDDNTTVTLAGNRHPDASAANDRGPAEDSLVLRRMILSLKSDASQDAALGEFLRAAQDRSSAQYGKWLNPQEFKKRFGAAQADIDSVRRWLTGHGFLIEEVSEGGRAIVFTGTAAQVREAFHTEIHRYLRKGMEHIANAGDPRIPAALQSVVDGIVSLHDFYSQPLHVRTGVQPDFTSGGTHYLAATDFDTIYQLDQLHGGGITGSGHSIAILGRSNVDINDMRQFRTVMNLPANPPQIILNGADPGFVEGDESESDLDLEWAGASAPSAAVIFVTSADTATSDGIDLSAQYAVNNNVADIISLSYGQCEASMGSAAVNFYNNLWQQAVAQGISVLVSSGDSGAAGCDSPSAASATHGSGVNGLCTSPYSTCVGGTLFADSSNPSQYWSSNTNPVNQGSALSYVPEMVWNESGVNGGGGLWATGGGASVHFSKPSWQSSMANVPNDHRRDVPDVALTAAVHDGYLTYTSDTAGRAQTLMVFGGTSASAPAFAGIVALINQKTGYRQGNLNPTLYGLASRQATGGPQSYFHQISSGNNSVPGQSGFSASSAKPYFNQATGLGSVNADVLVNHWTDLLPATTTTLSASPNPALPRQLVTLTAAVTGAAPTGTVQFKDGAAVLGTSAVSNGQAAFSTVSFAAGSHAITAAYSGDPNNAPSTSPQVNENVAYAQSSVALTSSAPSSMAGQSVTFTATVSGTSPTGTVQFKDGDTDMAAAAPLNGGIATLTTSSLSAGSHSITAWYSGDSMNSSSSSNAVIQSVGAGSAADADVPTLPQWGSIAFAMLLIMTMRSAARRNG